MRRISRVTATNQIPTSVFTKLTVLKQKFSHEKANTSIAVSRNTKQISAKTIFNKSLHLSKKSLSVIKKPVKNNKKYSEFSDKHFSHPSIVIENKELNNNNTANCASFFTSYKKPFESRIASANLRQQVSVCESQLPYYKKIVAEKRIQRELN